MYGRFSNPLTLVHDSQMRQQVRSDGGDRHDRFYLTLVSDLRETVHAFFDIGPRPLFGFIERIESTVERWTVIFRSRSIAAG